MKKGYNFKTSCDTELIGPGYHFFGNDFANGATQNLYTGNEASWTEDSGNTGTDLHSASPGSIPAPPYGDAAYDSTSHDYDPVGSFVDSNDFTLDFWLYLPTGSTATDMAMLFYGTNGYSHFVPRVTTTSVQLESAAQPDGTVSIFDWPVVEWSGWSSTVLSLTSNLYVPPSTKPNDEQFYHQSKIYSHLQDLLRLQCKFVSL